MTNRHVTPAAAKFYGVGWRLVKQAGKSNPIDAGIALAMALRVLSHEKENRPPTMAWSSTHPFTSLAPTWADRWQDGYDNEGCFACIGRGIGRMTALALPPAIGCRGRVVLQRLAPPCPPVEGSRFGSATKG